MELTLVFNTDYFEISMVSMTKTEYAHFHVIGSGAELPFKQIRQ
jgi:hypothetical protein